MPTSSNKAIIITIQRVKEKGNKEHIYENITNVKQFYFLLICGIYADYHLTNANNSKSKSLTVV